MTASITTHFFTHSTREILSEDQSVPSSSLTDLHLLSLAVRQGIGFLTLERRIDPMLITGGENALEMLE